jgi:hypothetical protein
MASEEFLEADFKALPDLPLPQIHRLEQGVDPSVDQEHLFIPLVSLGRNEMPGTEALQGFVIAGGGCLHIGSQIRENQQEGHRLIGIEILAFDP